MIAAKSPAQTPTTGQVHAMLSHLASGLGGGEPVWGALPHAFLAAGIDPFDAIGRLASREARVSALLDDLLPAEALARVVAGEDSGDLVDSLRGARRYLPLTLSR